jgi:hypothetical protein
MMERMRINHKFDWRIVYKINKEKEMEMEMDIKYKHEQMTHKRIMTM